jgi:hypothetical protein
MKSLKRKGNVSKRKKRGKRPKRRSDRLKRRQRSASVKKRRKRRSNSRKRDWKRNVNLRSNNDWNERSERNKLRSSKPKERQQENASALPKKKPGRENASRRSCCKPN